jgi:glycerophosphoryl diester phosphodiesterase
MSRIAFVGSMLVAIQWSLAAERASTSSQNPQAQNSFHIQAHRSAGIARPENTLESVRWAWELGVTPEVDLRVSKDGQIVCFHDANFARVLPNADAATQKLSVEKLTLAELEKLDVGSFRGPQFAGQRIPTLAAVLHEMRGRPERLLYIDIKKADLGPLAALIRKFDAQQQCIFTTTHYDLVRDWKKRVPESPTLLWNGSSVAERPNLEQILTRKMEELRKHDFRGITHLQIHVFAGDLGSAEPFNPSSHFLRTLGTELKSRGIVFQVLPWECSDPRVYEKLLALGAESFATDYPEVTLKAMQQFRRLGGQQP